MNVFYSNKISWVELNEYVFIFDELTNIIYSLEDISKEFWLLIQKNKGIGDIICELSEKYEVDFITIKDDITEFAEMLVNSNLLVWGDAS